VDPAIGEAAIGFLESSGMVMRTHAMAGKLLIMRDKRSQRLRQSVQAAELCRHCAIRSKQRRNGSCYTSEQQWTWARAISDIGRK